jgi:hypothetical protein
MTVCAACGDTSISGGTCQACGAPVTKPKARVQAPVVSQKHQRADARKHGSVPVPPPPPTPRVASSDPTSPPLSPPTVEPSAVPGWAEPPSASSAATSTPTPDGATAKPLNAGMPLAASIVFAAVIAGLAGTALAVIMFQTNSVWYYGYLLLGFVTGVAFRFRAQAATWRIRSILSPVFVFITMFISLYFLTRAFAVQDLTNNGQLLPGESIPLFVSVAQMVRVVKDVMHESPVLYFLWAIAMYVAYFIPSLPHRAQKQWAKAQAAQASQPPRQATRDDA